LPQLPLGSNAYRSPLIASPERTSGVRRGALTIIACATALSATILGLALAYRPETEPVARDTDSIPAAPRAAPPRAPASPLHGTSKPVERTAAIVSPATSDLVFAPAPKASEARPASTARSRRASAAKPARRDRTRERKAASNSVADSQLPVEPSRAAVLAAMTRIKPAALACFGSERGVANVTFFVRGKTGRVMNAHVSGLAGAEGSCIARAVRRATFPKFQKERLQISFPFKR
jgi:hypothetical protein